MANRAAKDGYLHRIAKESATTSNLFSGSLRRVFLQPTPSVETRGAAHRSKDEGPVPQVVRSQEGACQGIPSEQRKSQRKREDPDPHSTAEKSDEPGVAGGTGEVRSPPQVR